MFSDHVLRLELIFKKLKKIYFNIFLNKKYFKSLLLPQFQTHPLILSGTTKILD